MGKVALKILYKTLLYSAPVWLLVIYLEYRLGRVENSYSFKMENFEKLKNDCEILVLGNSEMLKGVNPEFLQATAFNMAHVSQTYSVDEQILVKYLEQLPKLKTVILGVSYLSFGEEIKNGSESWRIPFYHRYYGLQLNHEFDLRNHSNILCYTPYESMKMAFSNFRTDLVNGMQENGWMKVTGFKEEDQIDSQAVQRARMHTVGLHKKFVETNIRSLERMIKLLKSHHIEPVLVAPPVMEEYYNALDTQWLFRNDSIVTRFREEFKVNVIDLSSPGSNFNRYGSRLYSDVNHLNETGAEELSRYLAEEIKKAR
jgi:hypothetical protein